MISLWEKRASLAASRWPGWLLTAAVLRKVTVLRREARVRKREAIVTFAFLPTSFAASARTTSMPSSFPTAAVPS